MTRAFQSYDKNISAYTLTILHSTARREVVLLVATDDQGVVWVNGRRVLDSPGYVGPT